ncbi:chromate transporter [Lederbergia sp. NSJ-179]|uniref:chromate transporter n=1 Tax=Lederbergia sp. NSJ-179 TaxID=2931402 RepID=UPI001FD01121|nr:chromate transporter [Lederbergia sp. NSJ-179]MCJ7840177.1 chromate transporter [Lederbergia sp. NSJ-179]
MKQFHLFIAFFRSGILGFGGGPSAIPLVQHEVVRVYKWMSDDEFADVLALANALPGPINTKMAGYIGWRIGGFIGMMNALFATVVPTVVMMVVFLFLLSAYKDKPWVAGMSQAVLPVAGVLMGMLTWEFIAKSKRSLGWLGTILLLVGSLIVMQSLGVHPAIVVAVLLATALLSKKKQQSLKRNAEDKSLS